MNRPVAGILILCTPLGLAAQVTFTHDIAPIVARNCAPCHQAAGAAPFPLLTYEDVKKRAPQIAAVTRSRYMPPWLPEHGFGDFADERRLSADEIRIISDWVAEGAPEGAAAEVADGSAPSATDGQAMGPPHLVIEAQSSFTVPASGPDVYWNFVFRPDIDKTRYVKSIDIRPGDRRLVHHANLLVDRMATAHLQESAPGQGFPGMDLAIMRSPFDPDGDFLFWKPGAAPHVEPDGFAWRLDPGNELVLNVHLHPIGKAEEVRPAITLYFTDKFTDKPQMRFPLLVQLENDDALNIPPGVRDFPVSDDFRLPMDADILAVYPHAHYLGKLLEAYATLPGGARKWLVRIPDWDPNWQAVYYYREPVFLPKGSVISMRYHYDNSAANVRNPNHPPRRVKGGDQATDEMAHLWLQVLPRGAGDRRRELQEAVMLHRLEKSPDDFVARMNLGAVMLSRLNPQGAVSMLEAAVRIDPNRADARNMLGLALSQTGRTREAAAEFLAALKTRPDFLSARLNLAAVELKMGALDEAIGNLEILAKAEPENETIRQRLADAVAARGKR
ncbi:MAG: tetratricopeptide repeat protein [Bryobacteraceae bacterium]